MTGIFTWEDMPKRDPETGHRTMAGWISVTQKLSKYNILMIAYLTHALQSVYNAITGREYMVAIWYPYDKYSTPEFELTFPVQVRDPIFLTQEYSPPHIFKFD